MADHDSFDANLGKGCRFEGKLTFKGKVRIDGVFAGEIVTTDTIVLGEGADVRAEIDAGTIIVRGKLTGNARASQAIELKVPGEILGNIVAPVIQVDKGARFEGICKMTHPGAPAARPAFAPAPRAPVAAISAPAPQVAPVAVVTPAEVAARPDPIEPSDEPVSPRT